MGNFINHPHRPFQTDHHCNLMMDVRCLRAQVQFRVGETVVTRQHAVDFIEYGLRFPDFEVHPFLPRTICPISCPNFGIIP